MSRKKHKRSILVALAASALLAVAGCGSGEQDPGQVAREVQGKANCPSTLGPHAFELSAVKATPGLAQSSIADKKSTVAQATDRLVKWAGKLPYVKLLVGTNGMERLDFPAVDSDMDGNPDEVAQKLELSFPTDDWFLWLADPARGLALRWSVVVLTDGDAVKVVIGVPDTFVRLYFRGEPHLPLLRAWARWNHHRLRDIVHLALAGDGFTTRVNQGLPGTELTETTISSVEAMLGPVTAESIAPSLTIDGANVSVSQVVAAIETAFTAKRVPDLDADGDVDADDLQVLPTAMQQFLQGQMSETELAGMLGQGASLWGNGLTFQQWANPRTLQIGQVHVVELCQPFYAATALGTGLHHVPAMPCAVSVWQEGDVVRVNLLDPDVIFAYFFRDAAPQMPPAMQQLFAIFPAFVFNEMAGVVNAAMADLGATPRLALHNIGP
jgi:hypothetical protein